MIANIQRRRYFVTWLPTLPADGNNSQFQIYLQPGQKIRAEKFTLENLAWLGRGGNGTVFRMIVVSGDLRGLIVAVKFLQSLEDAERVARFNQEIQILERVNHPHVIKVLDKGEFKDRDRQIPFFVMEYQPRNLEREFEAHPRGFDPDSVLPLCLQMASALVHLHRKNIVHHDLKPSKVLFDGNNVKIADWGIARLVERSGLRSIVTPHGEELAPHFYISPEQWKWWRKETTDHPDKPSDIFQFGLIIYQMMTGFNPNTVHQWAEAEGEGAQQRVPSEKMRNWEESLFNDVGGIVREMVDVDSDARPAADWVQDRLLVLFRAYTSHFTALYGARPGREF